MKKLTRKNLDELAKVMPVISENEQRFYLGGNGGEIPSGSHTQPYTWEEYQALIASGNWNGGYIEGYGYILPNVVITAKELYPFNGNGIYFDGFASYLKHTNKDTWYDALAMYILESFSITGNIIDNWKETWSGMAATAIDKGYGDCEKIYVEVNGMSLSIYDAYTGELITSGVVSFF